jgi:hypothetical protein
MEDGLYHGLHSSGMLHGMGWYLVSNVSGQHIGTPPLKTEATGCFETSVTKLRAAPRYTQKREGFVCTAAEA